MADEYYTLHVAGLERQLKLFPVNEHMSIAAFILFGDVELCEHCADALLDKCPSFDYIVTPEAESIQLAYVMSRKSGKNYTEAHKNIKVYLYRTDKASDSSIQRT